MVFVELRIDQIHKGRVCAQHIGAFLGGTAFSGIIQNLLDVFLS